jgi:hypothetical protein
MAWFRSVLDRILPRGAPPTLAAPRVARASYDIAQTSVENTAHWQHADNFDADRANSPQVRQTARNRSRYETNNNPSLQGVVRTMVHFEVGQEGPALHAEHADKDFADEVENRWNQWWNATGGADKLAAMTYARIVDGESFARLGHNPNLDDPVQLDWQPFEADRCYTLWLPYQTPNRIDGIWFDDWGNPTYYDIARFHPGGTFPMPSWLWDTVPAQYVLHLYTPERPNQHRGMPEMGSSLDLWSDRRRHRKATIRAAETAADIALFLTTNMPASGTAAEVNDPGAIPIPRGSMMCAPEGYDAKQIASEHPNGTYEGFSAETLNEACRPGSVPLNIAKCDSSRYNMASGRLDITTFYSAVGVHQARTSRQVLARLFVAWYREARAVYGWESREAGEVPGQQWLWHGQPHSDPEAEQNADESAVSTGTKGLQEIYARRRVDWKRRAPLNAQAMGFKTTDEYLAWIRGNLTIAKGGGSTEEVASGQGPVASEEKTSTSS